MSETIENKEVEDDYRNALKELTVNSRPLITMLTMLAEESKEYAPLIVKVLTNHVQETHHKLPAMYLIDSIVKNVGIVYKRYLSTVLVNLFSTVFRNAEERTRKKLYELRQTWNEVFPHSRLYLLDVTIREMDPAWPITSQPKPTHSQSSTIHINPKKIKQVPQSLKPGVSSVPASHSSTSAPSASSASDSSKADLEELRELQLKRKLLEDQRRKVEMHIKHESKAGDSEKGSTNTIHVAPWKAKQIQQVAGKVPQFSPTQPSSGNSRDPRLATQLSNKEVPAKSALVSRDPPRQIEKGNPTATTASHKPRISTLSSVKAETYSPGYDPKKKNFHPQHVKAEVKPSTGHTEAHKSSHSRSKEPPPIRTSKEKERDKLKDKKDVINEKTKKESTLTAEKIEEKLFGIEKPPHSKEKEVERLKSLEKGQDKEGKKQHREKSKEKEREKVKNKDHKIEKEIPKKSQLDPETLKTKDKDSLTHRTDKKEKKKDAAKEPEEKWIMADRSIILNIKEEKQSVSNSSLTSTSEQSSIKIKSPSKKSQPTKEKTPKDKKNLKEKKSPKLQEKLEKKVPPKSAPPSEGPKKNPSDQRPKESSIPPSKDKICEKTSITKDVSSEKTASPPKDIPIKQNLSPQNTSHDDKGVSHLDNKNVVTSTQDEGNNTKPKPQKDIESKSAPIIDNCISSQKISSQKPDDKDATNPQDNDGDSTSQKEKTTTQNSNTKINSSKITPLDPHTLLDPQKKVTKVLDVISKDRNNDMNSSTPKDDLNCDIQTSTKPIDSGTKDSSLIDDFVNISPEMLKDISSDSLESLPKSSSPKDKNKDTKDGFDSEESDDYSANRPQPSKPNHRHKKDTLHPFPSTNSADVAISGGDIDLRQLTAHNKITLTEKKAVAPPNPFGILFGKEDVDLRTLAPPPSAFGSQSQQPPVAPSVPFNRTPLPLGVVELPDATQHQVEPPGSSSDREKLGRNSSSPARDSNIQAIQARRTSFNSPNAASWEKFRDKNPKFREYNRQASISEFEELDEPIRPMDSANNQGNQNRDTDERETWVSGKHNLLGSDKQGFGNRGNFNTRRSAHGGHSSRQNRVDKETFSKRKDATNKKNITWEEELTDEPDLPTVSEDNIRSIILENKTISIKLDNEPHSIRVYGERAIALKDWDDPRTVCFKRTQCHIDFDRQLVISVFSGDDYREFFIDGERHVVKIGVPSRELLIDGKPYQCFFGGKPISIFLSGKIRNVRLLGSPPQVDIGVEKNIEYLLGKIELIINPQKVLDLYLDAKPQQFYIDKMSFFVQFIDSFRAVSINGVRHSVDFGGLPICISVSGRRRYLSFTNLPPGVVQGEASVIGMGKDLYNMFPFPNKPLNAAAPSPLPPVPADTTPTPSFANYPPRDNLNPPLLPQPASNTPLLPNTTQPQIPIQANIIAGSYSSEGGEVFQLPHTNLPPPPVSQFASGIPIPPLNVPPPNIAPPPSHSLDINSLLVKLTQKGLIQGNTRPDEPRRNRPPKPSGEDHFEAEIDDLKDFPSKEEMFKLTNLRKRHSKIILRMYRGFQCSSCGLRYPSEQTEQYSHHLDWHFRMNKKQQDSAKKPNSRKYYLCIDDWIQYEEVEDLNERAPSMFEQDNSENKEENDEEEAIPSVPVSSDHLLGVCPLCHETFDQFFHHQTEDWHYKHAISVDGINYHPACHNDIVQKEKQEEEKRQKEEEEEEERKRKEEGGDEAENEKVVEISLDESDENSKGGDKKEEDQSKDSEELVIEEETKKEEDDDIKIEETKKEEKVYETIRIDDEEEEGKNDKDAADKEADNSEKTLTPHTAQKDKPTAVNISNDAYIPVRIKEELVENGDGQTEMRIYVPKPIPPILADIPIKVEIEDEAEKTPTFDVVDDDAPNVTEQSDEDHPTNWQPPSSTAETDIASCIDGNIEFTTAENSQPLTTIGPKIKISLTVPAKNSTQSDEEKAPEVNGTGPHDSPPIEEDPFEEFVPPPFSVDLSLKPSFEGVQLTDQPPELRGAEVSSLCSVM